MHSCMLLVLSIYLFFDLLTVSSLSVSVVVVDVLNLLGSALESMLPSDFVIEHGLSTCISSSVVLYSFRILM